MSTEMDSNHRVGRSSVLRDSLDCKKAFRMLVAVRSLLNPCDNVVDFRVPPP